MVSGIGGQGGFNVYEVGFTPVGEAAPQAKAGEVAKIPLDNNDTWEEDQAKPVAGGAKKSAKVSLPPSSASKSTEKTTFSAELYQVTILPEAAKTPIELPKSVTQSKDWKKLSAERQKTLTENVGFSKLTVTAQTSMVKLATALDDAAFAKVVGLFKHTEKISAEGQNLVISTVSNASKAAALADELAVLLKAKSFTAADNKTQVALLSQCKNFANTNSIKQLAKLSDVKWFGNMELADKQRAAKCIAFLAEVSIKTPGSDQNILLDNTLGRLLSGEIPLSFVAIDDDPGKITYGYAIDGEKGIYINEALVPAGNSAYPKNNATARHAVLATIPHEVSHQVNGDKNRATYKYFQAEYRAWYVGYIAEYGKEPTRQQAYDRCLELFQLYPNIDSARTGNWFGIWTDSDARKVIDFVQQFSAGTKLDLSDPDSADKILKLKVSSPKDAAPVPDPSLKPDLDN